MCWSVAKNLFEKSNASVEKFFSPDHFNKYFIDSATVLKQLSANNSSDNAANLLSNTPYVDINFGWSHVYPHDVVKSGHALKHRNPLISMNYLTIFLKKCL